MRLGFCFYIRSGKASARRRAVFFFCPSSFPLSAFSEEADGRRPLLLLLRSDVVVAPSPTGTYPHRPNIRSCLSVLPPPVAVSARFDPPTKGGRGEGCVVVVLYVIAE